MKSLSLLVAVTSALLLSGCMTSHSNTYSVGREFTSENVSKIVKGKTTSSDLVQMFGEPFMKTVMSDSEEKWIYTYTRGTATAQQEFLTMKMQNNGQTRTLDVLLKNGVVTNFAYTDRPEPSYQSK